MIHNVTSNTMASIKKKVAAALAPEKIRLLTSGEESLITGSGDSIDTVDKLLADLNDVNGKLDASVAMVTCLTSKEEERRHWVGRGWSDEQIS